MHDLMHALTNFDTDKNKKIKKDAAPKPQLSAFGPSNNYLKYYLLSETIDLFAFLSKYAMFTNGKGLSADCMIAKVAYFINSCRSVPLCAYKLDLLELHETFKLF